jgi:four helix bundle protein
MTLRIYPIVLQLVRRLSPYLPLLRTRSASLGDQLERALISVPLNIAEGAYSRGKNRLARYQSAAASAGSPGLFRNGRSARLGQAARA